MNISIKSIKDKRRRLKMSNCYTAKRFFKLYGAVFNVLLTHNIRMLPSYQLIS